ncbi:MAG TPA: hypothetical protein VGC79_32540 [Polyangiaceae bacterium]
MTINFGRLASWFWIGAGFTACAAQPPSEPNAPAASARAASAEEHAPNSESAPATAAPAPPAAPQGLDQPKSKDSRRNETDPLEFSSLEAAERAMNQAKADLDRLALAEPAPAVGHDSAADRAAEKKASKPGRAPSAAGAAAPVKSSAVCEDACRAFSSLSRAASAVCRLDGNSGTHCSHAKHVQADAEQRVASCACPAASD